MAPSSLVSEGQARMTESSAAVRDVPSKGRYGTPAWVASRYVPLALLGVAAFVLYAVSSLHLETTHRTTHFAADTWFYAELANGGVLGRIADNYYLDRIFRFHPTTVLLAAGWMKVLSPLTAWIAPLHLLKGLFSAIGAIGVCAAMWAFSAVVPRRTAILLGVIYASSLSIWYFSSIEESKIVTATLNALYIATYLHLRTVWTLPRAALLTAILLVACLNEIVAAFLVVIPLVDTLMQRSWGLRHIRWIVAHALAAPVALAILESLMRGRIGAAGFHPEGANHFSMFFYYLSKNDYSPLSLYTFAVRWLFFSVAAPSYDGSYGANAGINYGGDFEVALANYVSSPASAGLVVLFGVMLVAIVLPRYRAETLGGLTGVFLGLLAYAALRGVFFLVFIPHECILFSSSIVLAHLLVIAIPFAASRFPAKPGLLAAVAVLLLITNGAFIVGR
jgi:hypothetical protein